MTDLAAAVRAVRARSGVEPLAGLILGSGLGPLADAIDDPVVIPFGEIPGFAAVTIAGHSGRIIAGRLDGVPVVVQQGRFHLYEGHSPRAVAFPTRVLARLGVRGLIVTNAAGALDPAMRAGDLLILNDHINLMGRNPLIGARMEGEPRFPDMSAPYEARLQRAAEAVAVAAGIRVRRGVYCAVAGPSYETRAELRMLRAFGGDAVGMSTVPEVLAARAASVAVLGISVITNELVRPGGSPLTHEEVIASGTEARIRLETVVRGVLRAIAGTGTPA